MPDPELPRCANCRREHYEHAENGPWVCQDYRADLEEPEPERLRLDPNPYRWWRNPFRWNAEERARTDSARGIVWANLSMYERWQRRRENGRVYNESLDRARATRREVSDA